MMLLRMLYETLSPRAQHKDQSTINTRKPSTNLQGFSVLVCHLTTIV